MITNTPMISVEVQMHQVEYTKVYKKILTSNPLENKIINFEFENQLAAFDLEVVENSNNYKKDISLSSGKKNHIKLTCNKK